MVINKYNATEYAIKVREQVMGYGLILVGYALLILAGVLYFRTIWYWIPLFFLSVMFLIFGFNLIGVTEWD